MQREYKETVKILKQLDIHVGYKIKDFIFIANIYLSITFFFIK
jgi:hypothetical protein